MILVSSPMIHAGGLVTNTNQSAVWARTLTREATLGLDVGYYNPAGLHLSLSNQTIFQTRTITSSYPYLANAPGNYLRTVDSNPFLDGATVGLLNGTAAALDGATADKELNDYWCGFF